MSPFYELLAVFEGGRILSFCFVNLHDMEWLHQLACDGPDEEPEPETRDATATTVGAMKKALHEYLETQYRHYCNELRGGNGSQLLKPITQEYLAERIGKANRAFQRCWN